MQLTNEQTKLLDDTWNQYKETLLSCANKHKSTKKIGNNTALYSLFMCHEEIDLCKAEVVLLDVIVDIFGADVIIDWIDYNRFLGGFQAINCYLDDNLICTIPSNHTKQTT